MEEYLLKDGGEDHLRVNSHCAPAGRFTLQTHGEQELTGDG